MPEAPNLQEDARIAKLHEAWFLYNNLAKYKKSNSVLHYDFIQLVGKIIGQHTAWDNLANTTEFKKYILKEGFSA